MVKSKKATTRKRIVKATRATRRGLKKPTSSKRKVSKTKVSFEDAEQIEETARLQRSEDTRKRNADAQNYPQRRTKIKRSAEWDHRRADQDLDAQAFFDCIDDPLLKICGSCGELSKAARMVKKRYEPSNSYFSPLRNVNGVCEPILESCTIPDNDNVTFIWICSRCHTSLKKKAVPKFCRASGFEITPVPRELAVLNCMEARLVGLGISFTTCMNLYRDQQEFTRGNSVNYWNDVHEVTLSLPRPLSKSGVVLLRSKNATGELLVKVRPDVVRCALQWLIANNSLYKDVTISEENLTELTSINSEESVPCITITEEEESELRLSTTSELAKSICEREQTSRDEHCSSEKESNLAAYTASQLPPPSAPISQQNCISTESAYIEESFTLEFDHSDEQTESERIAKAANTAAGRTIYPVGDLVCKQDAINEYITQFLMQNCFPTLFPNGKGGLNPLLNGEERDHEYHLAEYCAHLMKWHDRRFVTHRNFKFFCLNLIQRRQIDGLVRKISSASNPTSAVQGEGCSDGMKRDISAAMKLLEALKPYFRGVRGSGLYWSNVRDDLLSMIGSRVLPSRWPTFFLTLSAADTIWPDFF